MGGEPYIATPRLARSYEDRHHTMRKIRLRRRDRRGPARGRVKTAGPAGWLLLGRTRSFDRVSGKGRCRRILPVAVRPGEGPLTETDSSHSTVAAATALPAPHPPFAIPAVIGSIGWEPVLRWDASGRPRLRRELPFRRVDHNRVVLAKNI